MYVNGYPKMLVFLSFTDRKDNEFETISNILFNKISNKFILKIQKIILIDIKILKQKQNNA